MKVCIFAILLAIALIPAEAVSNHDALLLDVYRAYPYEFAVSRAGADNDLKALDNLYNNYEWDPTLKFRFVGNKFFSKSAKNRVLDLLGSAADQDPESGSYGKSAGRPKFPDNYKDVYLQIWYEATTVELMVDKCNSYPAVCRYMVLNNEFPLFELSVMGEYRSFNVEPSEGALLNAKLLPPVYQQQVELVSQLTRVKDHRLQDLFVWALLKCRGEFDDVNAHVIAFGLHQYELERRPTLEQLESLVSLLAKGFKLLSRSESDTYTFQNTLISQALTMAGGISIDDQLHEEVFKLKADVRHKKDSDDSFEVVKLQDSGEEVVSVGPFQPWNYLSVLVSSQYLLEESQFRAMVARIWKFLSLQDVNQCLVKNSAQRRPDALKPNRDVRQTPDKDADLNGRLLFARSLAKIERLQEGVIQLLDYAQTINAGVSSFVITQRVVRMLLSFSLYITPDRKCQDYAEQISGLINLSIGEQAQVLLAEYNQEREHIKKCVGLLPVEQQYFAQIMRIKDVTERLRDVNFVIKLLNNKRISLDDVVTYEMRRVLHHKNAVSFDFPLLHKLLIDLGYPLQNPLPLLKTCLENRWYRLYSLLRRFSDLQGKSEFELSNYSNHHPWYMALHKQKSWRRSIAVALQRLRHWKTFYN
ncbi:hypothetical protein MP228_002474 [Amoeboaphelidium protococcarum]|nr:hypothetical protein MP228_002474 [Amoeboaphelidium protococcarum]